MRIEKPKDKKQEKPSWLSIISPETQRNGEVCLDRVLPN